MENIDLILQEYRNQIDTMDREIVYLLSRRFSAVKSIWDIKKLNNINALQPWRWQEVIDKLKENWDEFWVDFDFLENIWNLIHKEALRLEEK